MERAEQDIKKSFIGTAEKMKAEGKGYADLGVYLKGKYQEMNYLSDSDIKDIDDDGEFFKTEYSWYRTMLAKSYRKAGFFWMALGSLVTGISYFSALPGEKYVLTIGFFIFGIFMFAKASQYVVPLR